MSQKGRKQKAEQDPRRTHTHIAVTSAAGKNAYVAEVLKSTRQQFGALDPHGDMLPIAGELSSPIDETETSHKEEVLTSGSVVPPI